MSLQPAVSEPSDIYQTLLTSADWQSKYCMHIDSV